MILILDVCCILQEGAEKVDGGRLRTPLEMGSGNFGVGEQSRDGAEKNRGCKLSGGRGEEVECEGAGHCGDGWSRFNRWRSCTSCTFGWRMSRLRRRRGVVKTEAGSSELKESVNERGMRDKHGCDGITQCSNTLSSVRSRWSGCRRGKGGEQGSCVERDEEREEKEAQALIGGGSSNVSKERDVEEREGVLRESRCGGRSRRILWKEGKGWGDGEVRSGG